MFGITIRSLYVHKCTFLYMDRVANQERILSCNVYRVSLCVQWCFFSLLVPLIYQCFGAVYETFARCVYLQIYIFAAFTERITPHHLYKERSKKTRTWKNSTSLMKREALARARCEKVCNLLCYINYDHRYISSLTYYILCVCVFTAGLSFSFHAELWMCLCLCTFCLFSHRISTEWFKRIW